MTINEALRMLLEIEEAKRENIIGEDTIALGIARAGSSDCVTKAGRIAKLIDYNFGPPPHTLIIPSKLHFIEEEALKTLHNLEEV